MATSPPVPFRRLLNYANALRIIDEVSGRIARQGRTFRIEDLDEFPEGNGFRYQLLEGSLLVSPATVATIEEAFSVDDLELLSGDTNRYELIEGSLFVTPAPAPMHQRIDMNLRFLLRRACPAEFEILGAPIDVQLGEGTVVQPDLLVRPATPLPATRLDEPPVLVVEILSPTTRLYDLGTKRAVYQEAGVGAFWAVDPAGPSLTAWRWEGDDESVERIAGDTTATLTWPFTVEITPARLLLAGG